MCTMPATPSTPERDDLGRLVRDRRAALGISLAAAAEAAGDPQLRTWINRLELGQIREIPDRTRLEALARGVQLPARQVLRAAAAQWWGLDTTTSEDGTVVAVVDHMAEMSEAEQRQVAAIVEAFARSREG